MEIGNRPDTYHLETAQRIDALLAQVHECKPEDRFGILHELAELLNIETVQEIAASAAGLSLYIMRLQNIEKAVIERQLIEHKSPGQELH